ncbi:LacI family DNA-binding transcriptional regulator [Curtobacterium sp. B8]|uniref:LacI family DNA-binding transcriptional regulator n=1 Tax=Curtobacterium sp. B8 TaxID=95611 RepID=UPI0004CDF935|nr:LacI family DNA-binding transcriptional regulator [Curtobacterium sp. B8]
MSQPATVADVAAAAGVSRQTVSNALNRPEIVRPATLTRVRAAIDELGYRPHASARRLRTRQSSTLGVRLPPVHGISGAVLDRFLHALVERADERGMRILLFTATDLDDELAHMERLVEGSDVDGFVLTSTAHGDPRAAWLGERDVPFVTFGRPWGVPDMDDAPHPWVDVDGRAGLREATAGLVARGHRRIGFLGWPSPSGQGDERRLGWRDALGDAGLGAPPAGSADAGLGAPPAGSADAAADGSTGAGSGSGAVDLACEDDVAAATAVVAAALQGGTVFDAVVCASETLALGARFALGAEVPVVGYDDTPVAAAVGISSVEQPLDAAAAAAVELLMGSGRSVLPASGGHRLLAPHVVWRG